MSARAVVLAAALLACARACYWNNKCTYTYYGSKTVYDDVRGDIRDVPGFKGCEPAAIWALIRHGTRHPSSTNVGNMRDAAEFKTDIVRSHLEGRGEMCAQDISNLQSWSWWDIIASTPGHLTKEGFGELYDLGARFNERFLPLLQDLDQYHFRPTLEQRTIESAKAFVEGLGQGYEYMKFEQENATDRDDVLRPYLYCTKHNVEVYKGPRSPLEMEKYHETEEFQLLLKDVQKRIGLDEPLTPTNVSGLYDLCRFFRAFAATRTSPWCALFSDQELERLEYLNDLRHYYRNGYGSAINMKLGRPTLKDLLQNFQDIVQGARKSFTGYFSHDSTLQMVYSALGLFRDYPEISGFERIPSRKWRTSFMAPFAGNFVAVLHKCSNGSTDYQVQFFINEVEMHLCNTRTCSWKEFIEKFEPFANSNLEFCDLDNSSTTTARAF